MALPSAGNAAGFVSEELRFIWASEKRVDVPAEKWHTIEIPITSPTTVEVHVQVHNKVFPDVSAWVCDKENYQRYINGSRARCSGYNRRKGRFSFEYVADRPGPHFLILDNTFSVMLTKKTSVSVALTTTLPEEQREALRTSFAAASDEIQERFKVQEFDIGLNSCGQKNAFSETRGGHITICSELFFDLVRKDLRGALEAILYHELGHSLLNLLGLPNWANEETADEFAVVMLLWAGRQEQAIDWLEYYENRDAWREAAMVIEHGDRHPLSVQRQRNIKRILDNPEATVDRWNKLLYPHLTETALQGIIDNPGRFHDRQLAQQVLAE